MVHCNIFAQVYRVLTGFHWYLFWWMGNEQFLEPFLLFGSPQLVERLGFLLVELAAAYQQFAVAIPTRLTLGGGGGDLSSFNYPTNFFINLDQIIYTAQNTNHARSFFPIKLNIRLK